MIKATQIIEIILIRKKIRNQSVIRINFQIFNSEFSKNLEFTERVEGINVLIEQNHSEIGELCGSSAYTGWI